MPHYCATCNEPLIAGIAQDSPGKNPLQHQPGGSHYNNKAIQPIEYILANKLGFCEGNIIKYVTRYTEKNGLDDLAKARHYVDFLISNN